MSINDIFVEWQIVNRLVHCMLLYCIYSDIFVHCTALIKPVTGYRKSSSFSDKLLNCTSTFCTVAHRNMSTTRLYHGGGVNGISEMIRYHPALVQRPLISLRLKKNRHVHLGWHGVSTSSGKCYSGGGLILWIGFWGSLGWLTRVRARERWWRMRSGRSPRWWSSFGSGRTSSPAPPVLH